MNTSYKMFRLLHLCFFIRHFGFMLAVQNQVQQRIVHFDLARGTGRTLGEFVSLPPLGAPVTTHRILSRRRGIFLIAENAAHFTHRLRQPVVFASKT
ncbi:MAG: hypothetical protein ACREB8_11980 [Pseudolabrys sp.]